MRSLSDIAPIANDQADNISGREVGSRFRQRDPPQKSRAVLYRAGRFDEALAKLNEANDLQGDPKHGSNSSPAYT